MAKVISPRTNVVRSFNSSHQPQPRAPISMDAAAVAGSEHTERVLLLEDEAQTNFILREYLGSLGYQVVAVANGVDGLKEVIKSDFELVICDMMMPKLPGDMFYLAVQKTRPQLCNRFVFITGHQQNAAVDAFIERTHSAILVKPFRLQQLEAAMEGILSRFPKKLHPIESSAHESPAPAEPTFRQAEPPLRSPVEAAPEKSSMVRKIVGLIRGHSHPSLIQGSDPRPAPKITVRVPNEARKITRRIPHLANAPIVTPTSEAIKVVGKVEPAAPRVTRKVAAPKAKEASMAMERQEQPKVTRTVPKAENIIRVKHADLPTPVSQPTKARLTRKIITPVASTPPKVTRNIPKITVDSAKNTGSSPKVTRNIPKVARKIAATPQNVAPVSQNPKVTIRVPKTTLKIAPPRTIPAPNMEARITQKVAPKVTAKIAPKVSRKIEKPVSAVITRRITTEKKRS